MTTTALAAIPDPPPRLAEFNPADWAVPSPTAGLPRYSHALEEFTGATHHTHPGLWQREQWRHAREQWGAEHGLAWTETETILARAAARLRADRARRYVPAPPEQLAAEATAVTPEQGATSPVSGPPHTHPARTPLTDRGIAVDRSQRHPGRTPDTPGGQPPAASRRLPRSAAAGAVYGTGGSDPDATEPLS